MPNHVHVNIQILDPHFVPGGGQIKWHGLDEIVRAFKSFSSRAINEHLGTPGETRWQRSFYDHIIRDERALQRIRDYIMSNSLQWELDRENPSAVGSDPLFTFVEEEDARPLPLTRQGGRVFDSPLQRPYNAPTTPHSATASPLHRHYNAPASFRVR